MKKTVDKLLKDIQDQINDNIHELNDPDEASWNYQIGVLISANEANLLLSELTRLQTENNELQNTISKIKPDFPDTKIRELNPIWVRDEIIKQLTNK